MKQFQSLTADRVWQDAVKELIERPEYQLNGRNGITHEIVPCVLRIEDPRQRWILSRRPPYNPAFGLVEFIWMITGHNESRVVNYWNPALPKFAGSGDVYPGAYGFRLRYACGLDQIERAYHALSNVPETRQIVLQIWKPEIDLPASNGQPVSEDIPCNIISLLKVRDGRLHWTQIMRSNDIMRGFPNDILQFTMLQEVMAGWLGMQPGDYIHLSDSLHVYKQDLSNFSCVPTNSESTDKESFSMTYNESNKIFSLIYADLVEVSKGGKKEDELREIFDRDSGRQAGHCELIKDIMVVIGSDAASRHNYTDLSYYLVDSCADLDLKRASQAWLDSKEGRK
jgi:thymidylate synthase